MHWRVYRGILLVPQCYNLCRKIFKISSVLCIGGCIKNSPCPIMPQFVLKDFKKYLHYYALEGVSRDSTCPTMPQFV